METLKKIGERMSRPIIQRVIDRYGNLKVETQIDNNMSDARIFNELVKNLGRPRSQCSNRYQKHEDEMKKS